MDRKRLLVLAFSAFGGAASWALSRVVESLAWLPYVVLPISLVAMLAIGAQIFFEWQRERRRRKLPGFSVHLVLWIDYMGDGQRHFLFDYTKPGAPGGCLFLSASGRFVFTVTDTKGEPYSIEVPAGPHGFVIQETAYFAAEAGTDGLTTEMRLSVNGKAIVTRTLPFSIDFGAMDLAGGTIGADRFGKQNAKFRLYFQLERDRTLDHDEQRQFSAYLAEKFKLRVA